MAATRTQIYLTVEQRRSLDARSRVTGDPLAKLIREAVDAYLAENTLDIDKVWYGILLTINLELALISPPVAMNLVVIKSITKAPLAEINKAAIPYMLMMALAILLLILAPEIALWLPQTMGYVTR